MQRTHVVQVVIYELHRGREMGGAWGGRDEEEEEVLGKGRKQSPLVWAYSLWH